MDNKILKAKEYYLESARVLGEIKNSVNDQGYWDGDYGNWDDIIAICNLESMLSLGVSFDEHWIVKRNGISFEASLDKTIQYLNSRMFVTKDECKFGEDLWDLFRLMNMIENFKLERRFSKYRQFSDYCKKVIKNKAFEINTRWKGPGVIAVVYEYAFRRKLKGRDELINMLISLRHEDCMWGNGSPQMRVWHTAQVIKALALSGRLEEIQPSLDKIYECTLCKEFDEDYFLNCYYCVYAALAYIYSNHTDDAHFSSIIQRSILPRVYQLDLDRGGLSMLAELFSYYYLYGESEATFPFINSIVRSNEINSAIREIQALKKENAALSNEIKDQSKYYFVRKSIVNVLKWILVAIISTILTTIVTTYVKSLIGG